VSLKVEQHLDWCNNDGVEGVELMRTVLRAIEYVPVVCGFFLLFHNQTIPAFVAFALYVPVNQLMRYLEVKRLRNGVESSGIKQYNTHLFDIGGDIDVGGDISQASNQFNFQVKQYK